MVGMALQPPVQNAAYSSGHAQMGDHRAAMNSASEDRLHHYLKGLWADALWAKRPHETELFRSLRQRRGEYSPELRSQLQQANANDVFLQLTENKCRAARAWINDIIKNSGTRPWGLEPTPVPDLPEDAKERMAMAAQSLLAEGMEPAQVMMLMQDGSVETEVMMGIAQEAKDKAERMTDAIEDQLVEGKFWHHLDSMVDDFVTYSAAFMMGPITRRVRTLEWRNNVPQIGSKLQVTWKRVSPFDVYPAPNATDVHDGYLFVHERYMQDDLFQMRGLPGVDDAKLDYILREHGQGGLRGWLSNLSDTEREHAEGRYYEQYAREGHIDALRYYGSVQAAILAEWGVEGFENRAGDVEPIQVECLLIQNYVVRVRVNPYPTGRKPIFKACALPRPGSFWGDSLPHLMGDLQDIVNFAARSLAENMSMASGPQVAIDRNALAPGELANNIYAWKIWNMNSENLGEHHGKLPIEFFQPDMHAIELQQIINWATQTADLVTGIPAYTTGGEQLAAGGAADTASGLSMLMSSQAKGMREMLSECGDVVRDMIEQLYIYNMLFHPDQSIKGDVQVKTGGFVVALQEQTMQMRRQEFLQQTNNPIDLQITGLEGRAAVLRKIASTLDIDSEEVVPKRQNMLNAAMPGMGMGAPMGAMPGANAPMPGLAAPQTEGNVADQVAG